MLKKIINRIKEILITFIDLYKFKQLIVTNNNKLNVFISHSADASGGAPVVLYELAKELNKSNDSKVVFLTHRNGNLVKLCKENNIEVFETFFLYRIYLILLNKFYKDINFIVVNTIVNYSYLQYLEKLNYLGKVIWWVHESKDLLVSYKKIIRKYNLPCFKICCVSDNIVNNIIKLTNLSASDLRLLPYGINDNGILPEKKREKIFSISIIGRLSERKNQFELIQAYKILPSTLKNNIKINIVAGSYDINYLEKLKKAITNCTNINICNPIPRDQMKKVYENSDLIVCTSKDDPLPVVVTEAMMYGKLFITSNKTGQASFIKNKYNGYIYNRGDVKFLSEFIKDCFLNYTKYNVIRYKTRELYLKTFSLQGVHSSLKDILEKM